MKVPLSTIYEDLNFASDRLNSQTRTLTVGVLALVWLFLSGAKDVAALRLIAGKKQLLALAGLCVLTFVIESVQYFASYISSNAVRKEAEDRNQKEAAYDESSRIRLLQLGCFWTKQIIAALAAGWLLLILTLSIVR
jgi:hypothetical protein